MRRLLRAPGFALVVILTIGLVVGADATIFTALNAVLLRELPVPEPERLVRAAAIMPRGETREDFPYGDFVALRDASTQASIAAFSRMQVTALDPLSRRVESVGTELVSENFFDVLRAPLARGTTGVVVSRALEQRMFDGDALGRAIQIHGRTETITGIAREPFRGTNLAAPADVWLPLDSSGARLGRASGSAPEAHTTPATVRLIGAALTLLLAAIGLFGVISASVTHRARELAIRAAHGATRGSLARLIAAGSGRLLLSGALAGAALSIPAARALTSLLFGVDAFDAITWTAVALLVTCTVAAATALPARRAMRVSPSALLRES